MSVSAVRDIQLQPDQAPSSSSPTAALATHGSGVLIISTQCDSVVASFNILEPACSLAWHPGAGRSYSLFAGLQTGMIAELDFRRLGAPVRMLQLANRVPLHSITILPPMQLGHAISPVAASIGYGEPLAMPMGLVASAAGAYAFWEDGTLVPLALNQPPPAAAGQLRGGQGLHDCCDCMSVAFSSSSPQVVAEWDSHIYRHGQVQGAGPYGGYPSAPAAGSAQAGAQASSQGRQALAVDCGLDIVLSWRGQGAASGNASSTHRGQTTGTSPCHRAGPLMIHAWAVGHADVTPCPGAAAGRALSGAAYGLSRGGASQQHTVSMRAGHAPAAAFMPMMALHGHAGMSTGCRGCILPASMSMVSHAVHPNLPQAGLPSGPFFCSGDEVSRMPLLWSLGSGSLVQALQPHSTPVGFCAAASGPAGSGVLLGCCSSKQLKLYSCA